LFSERFEFKAEEVPVKGIFKDFQSPLSVIRQRALSFQNKPESQNGGWPRPCLFHLQLYRNSLKLNFSVRQLRGSQQPLGDLRIDKEP
jgi:hypothetical protein